MSLETLVHDTLATLCPRVFPDFAQYSTVRPYVTYQQIGGKALAYIDDTAPDKRCARVQVNVWCDTRAQAVDLMLQVEQALQSAAGFQARAESAMQATFDEDTAVRGAMQDFEIWATR